GRTRRPHPPQGRARPAPRRPTPAQGLAVRPHPPDLRPAPVHPCAHRARLRLLGRCPMKDGRIPPSQFDQTRYERPNKDWICGHACDGCACRIGPGPSAECRATPECTPRLVTPAGETKGTWKCTRPKDWGGACESGPLPDGTCCKTIIKCNPVRSLRARRGLVTRITLVAAAAMLLIAFGGGLREAFINPGPLSAHHSGGAFVRETALLLDMPAGDAGQGCVACHREAAEDFGGLLASASAAHRTGLSPARFIEPHPRDF